MASTVVIITSILGAATQLASRDFVWYSYNNETGLSDPNTGLDTPSQKFYICCIGLLTALFGFCGYEGGAHMAEETTDASKSAPKGIIMTCIATAIFGFTYLLGLLYASGC